VPVGSEAVDHPSGPVLHGERVEIMAALVPAGLARLARRAGQLVRTLARYEPVAVTKLAEQRGRHGVRNVGNRIDIRHRRQVLVEHPRLT
jgi:hypothetical protein